MSARALAMLDRAIAGVDAHKRQARSRECGLVWLGWKVGLQEARRMIARYGQEVPMVPAIGRIIHVRNPAWKGVRPAMIVDAGQHAGDVFRVVRANVELNGFTDKEVRALWSTRAEGMTIDVPLALDEQAGVDHPAERPAPNWSYSGCWAHWPPRV